MPWDSGVSMPECYCAGKTDHGQCLGCVRDFSLYEEEGSGKAGINGTKARYGQGLRQGEMEFFLEHCMLRLGFAESWVRLIMRCVTSVSLSLLMDGQPSPKFIPGRGLRQGDALSPFLFLLCAERLSGMLKMSEQQGRICGISVARGAPRVSHLFFC